MLSFMNFHKIYMDSLNSRSRDRKAVDAFDYYLKSIYTHSVRI